MIGNIRGAAALVAVMAMTACQSMPNVPSSIFASGPPVCPDLQPGPSPYAPPFPAECQTMNKTASGVRYIPITNGDQAGGSPDMDATIVVHYQAYLAEQGTEIDSSYARDQSSVFKMTDLIEGWAEAVQLMNPGDEWLVFVPSAEAFGEIALDDLIPAGSDLVYRVKLDGFLTSDQLQAASQEGAPQAAAPDAAQTVGISIPLGPDMAAWQAFFPWDAEKEGVTTLPSGLSIAALERGNADLPTARESDSVLVHYEGRLAESSEFFDSSWSRGEPTQFPVGALIPGFTEALTLMRPGDRFLVHIPAELAYGEDGFGDDVPPGADLMFQINLLQIQTAD